jgi:hypothetical protein
MHDIYLPFSYNNLVQALTQSMQRRDAPKAYRINPETYKQLVDIAPAFASLKMLWTAVLVVSPNTPVGVIELVHIPSSTTDQDIRMVLPPTLVCGCLHGLHPTQSLEVPVPCIAP